VTEAAPEAAPEAATVGRHPSLHGHTIAWERRGEGQGPTLVLLHGLATDRRVLIEICEPVFTAPGMPPSQRLYLELPGHGQSPVSAAAKAAQAFSTDELVATLGDTIRALCPDPVALVGYAFGGYLVQGLVRELVGVRGVFLICPTVEADFGRRTVPPRRVLRNHEELVFSDDPRERAAFDEVAVLQTPATLERFQTLIHPANIAADQDAMAATRARYVMSRPYLQSLAAYAGPVAIVCGRDDHWVGFEDAVRLVRAFARCEFQVLPDCGQLLPIEATASLQRALASWLARV